MSWRNELIERLCEKPRCGYGEIDSFATEPSSLAALALINEGRLDKANEVARWLAEMQLADGSVGIRAGVPQPCWPTSLAMLVWAALKHVESRTTYDYPIARATVWILNAGQISAQRPTKLSHDPTIEAWPWVEGTYSWVEPTALNVLALRAIGYAGHVRVRYAIRMLLDRQLSGGGWNYGNTVVMNRELRPHIQPTGIALLALGLQPPDYHLLDPSLKCLHSGLNDQTATSSLCWGILGLAAHGETLADSDRWLEAAYYRAIRRDRSPLKFALIAMASQYERSLLVTLTAPHPNPLAGRTTPDELSQFAAEKE